MREFANENGNGNGTAGVGELYFGNGMALEVGRANKRGLREVRVRMNGTLHVDEINVKKADRRSRFIAAAAAKFNREADEISDLDQRILSVADHVDRIAAMENSVTELAAGDDTPAADTPAAEPASPETVAAAEAFLHNPNILEELLQDFRDLGIVGEETLATSVYLVGTSRKLYKPLGGSTQASTASGKSHVTGTTVDLLPPSEVLRATRITPKAMYYLGPDDLRHKLVYLAERQFASTKDPGEAANATLALREMLSSGVLRACVTMTVNGELKTRNLEIEGPIAYLDTTTELEVYSEDANRLLSLATDETPEQTAAILAAQRAWAAGPRQSSAARDAIRRKHRHAQGLLRTLYVRIPFAMHLHIPTAQIVARRAFPQLLAVIQTAAILRQYQKDVVDDTIDADLDDYRIAHRVMLPALNRIFAPLAPRARDLLDILRQHVACGPDGTPYTMANESFTRQDCATWSGFCLTEVGKRLGILCTAGYVAQLDGQRGVQYRYRLTPSTATSDRQVTGLPTPEELAQMWHPTN